MSVKNKQAITARLSLIHSHANYLFTDGEYHLVDLYYQDVMRNFFMNSGYKSTSETINIAGNRSEIAVHAEDWFKEKGIIAKPLPGNRLKLGNTGTE